MNTNTIINNNKDNMTPQTPVIPKVCEKHIIIDEEEAKENGKENLQEQKPNTLTYNLDDIELKKISLDKNICVRILNNINGTFVDIRKYYKGYPTKRGIRFSTFMFKKIIEYLKDDLK